MIVSVSAYGYYEFQVAEAEREAIEAVQEERRVRATEIAQIISDEGLRYCVYSDSRGFATIGFGHLIKPDEKFTCIDSHEAVKLLRDDYTYAENSVDNTYYWAYGEARLVLINMTFQMGATGVSKFDKSLTCMQDEDYDCAAAELLDSNWAKQTPNRAKRLAARIMAIE